MNDSVVVDFRDLQLKWAVDEVTNALQKLIPKIDQIDDIELLNSITDYLQAMHDYVVTVESLRQVLNG